MRYWWVNQNQTYRQEIEGGYLWSPKRNANGARNPWQAKLRERSSLNGISLASLVGRRPKSGSKWVRLMLNRFPHEGAT